MIEWILLAGGLIVLLLTYLYAQEEETKIATTIFVIFIVGATCAIGGSNITDTHYHIVTTRENVVPLSSVDKTLFYIENSKEGQVYIWYVDRKGKLPEEQRVKQEEAKVHLHSIPKGNHGYVLLHTTHETKDSKPVWSFHDWCNKDAYYYLWDLYVPEGSIVGPVSIRKE